MNELLHKVKRQGFPRVRGDRPPLGLSSDVASRFPPRARGDLRNTRGEWPKTAILNLQCASDQNDDAA